MISLNVEETSGGILDVFSTRRLHCLWGTLVCDVFDIGILAGGRRRRRWLRWTAGLAACLKEYDFLQKGTIDLKESGHTLSFSMCRSWRQRWLEDLFLCLLHDVRGRL